MFPTAARDITCYRNADFRLPVNILSGGAAADLTGWTLEMQIRTAPGAAGSPLVDLTIGSGITMVNITLGQFELVITEAALQALPAATPPAPCTTFAYDLRGAPPAGDTSVLFGGAFNLLTGVTR